MECPRCGLRIESYPHPLPTVDILIEVGGKETPAVLLIRRKNPPHGWAIPGGFIDGGESAEAAAVREAREETGLAVRKLRLFGVYSDPARDPRHATISAVFLAEASGAPRAASDASACAAFTREALPSEIAFDHAGILEDYFAWREGKRASLPREKEG